MPTLRKPARAGSFYPSNADECASTVRHFVNIATAIQSLEKMPYGAIVPHAGWMCCGEVIGKVMRAIANEGSPQTIVLFGAMHMTHSRVAHLYPAGQWATPIGEVSVEQELASAIGKQVELLEANPGAHAEEHSIEVIVPFLINTFPGCRIVPILVPPIPQAVQIGQQVAKILDESSESTIVIGSTDLTHYGNAYGFTPQGHDDAGLEWARNVNDRKLIEKMESLDAESVVHQAVEHRSACGAGAIAATLAASRSRGAEKGLVLQHTTSREVLGDRGFDGSVGYVGMVFV